MRDHSTTVDWAMWLRTWSVDDLYRAEKVIIPLGDRRHCKLCDRSIQESTSDHHRGHMEDLEGYAEQKSAEPRGPLPASRSRSFARGLRRDQQREWTRDQGLDPYLYVVERFAPVSRNPDDPRRKAIVRRKLRHPRGDTRERIRVLLEQGVLPAAIADQLKISDDYVRRLTREIKAGKGLI